MDRLERAIEAIQASIESQGGELTVKMKVTSTLVVFVRLLIPIYFPLFSPKQSRKQKNTTLLSCSHVLPKRTPKSLGTKRKRSKLICILLTRDGRAIAAGMTL